MTIHDIPSPTKNIHTIGGNQCCCGQTPMQTVTDGKNLDEKSITEFDLTDSS